MKLSDHITEMIFLLNRVKTQIQNSDSFLWCKKESAEGMVEDLDTCITKLEQGNVSDLSSLYYLWYPTSDCQELSLDNGWGELYITLADNFDVLFERIIGKPKKSPTT